MMDRASFLKGLACTSVVPMALTACSRGQSMPTADRVVSDTLGVHDLRTDTPPIDKPLEEWQSTLDAEAFRILFEEGTEPRGSSSLLEEKRTGTYICAACRLPLFSSKTKYDSGTGWPSFWAPLEKRVDTKKDTKLGYVRTEYHCRRCEGHQGHIFEDGPEPTGLRYCNNGLALRFVPADEALPPLRT